MLFRIVMSAWPVLPGTMKIFHGKPKSLKRIQRYKGISGMTQGVTTTLKTVTSPILFVTVGISPILESCLTTLGEPILKTSSSACSLMLHSPCQFSAFC